IIHMLTPKKIVHSFCKYKKTILKNKKVLEMKKINKLELIRKSKSHAKIMTLYKSKFSLKWKK
ncbi:MAG: hypothetical protein ACK55Z_33600, partial [bacterium]